MARLIWKIVIIGDPAVGKTSIRRKYLGETTQKEYIYTIGADFATKKITLSDNLSIQYQIFDLAGQTKFDKVRSSFYSGVQAAILVYDITSSETLANLPKWVKEVKKNNDGTLETFVVVGNKIDLKEQKQCNDKELNNFLNSLSKEMGHNILHIYTSALTGENIDLLFKKITEQLLFSASKESPQIANLAKDFLPEKPPVKKVEKIPEIPIRIDKKQEAENPLEKKLNHFELEINHIKLEIQDIHTDINYLKDLILKFLYENKKILEELNINID
ncbi:MAG: GTP-binding protein [Candidatus Heimdallarchaeota archaeon]|nr:GTP-binding protein [Candidatus Heimdallarchaeota archaeon]